MFNSGLSCLKTGVVSLATFLLVQPMLKCPESISSYRYTMYTCIVTIAGFIKLSYTFNHECTLYVHVYVYCIHVDHAVLCEDR